MTAAMLGAEHAGEEIVGTVSSGGTESIFLAVKAYRDRAGIAEPEMVLPTTAHAAFHKAAHLLGVRAVKVPVGDDGRADVAATEAALGERTILLVGSAPGFPHGLIDPIEELSELALARGVGFHTDACLGGFLLPWAERLGRPVPPFDFRLPGVTSMSADTHKFGYAPKGTSVVLYRGAELRHHQYFTVADWPGGLYCSPTLAGSRPGALIAACWAALVSMGESGYLEAAHRILTTADAIKRGVAAIPELSVIGDPLFCIAFRSEAVDVYRVMDSMSARGWSLNGLQRPPAVHICVTLRQTQPGVAERFEADLRAAVAEARGPSPSDGGMAPRAIPGSCGRA
jgi:sphinganine-1-phosphate aldolase